MCTASGITFYKKARKGRVDIIFPVQNFIYLLFYYMKFKGEQSHKSQRC